MTNNLPVATLLTVSGGFLDSYAWVAHGHVFTSAISGNIILFGVFAAERHWQQAMPHLPPTLAFFVGVAAAQWLRWRCPPERAPSAPLVSLGVEMAVLAAVSVLPAQVPDALVVVAIAFVAAMQNSSFERVEGWSYASVVTTGNARSAMEAFYAGVFPRHDPGARRKAKVFGTICAGFAVGAVVGAVLTVRYGKAAVLFPVALQSLALRPGAAEARTGRPAASTRRD